MNLPCRGNQNGSIFALPGGDRLLECRTIFVAGVTVDHIYAHYGVRNDGQNLLLEVSSVLFE